jgi:hypothetical protein
MTKTERIKKTKAMVASLREEAADRMPDQLARIERIGALMLHAAANPPPRLVEIFALMEAEGFSALTDEKLAEMREILRVMALDLHTGPTH